MSAQDQAAAASGAAGTADPLRDWDAVRHAGDIQFAPVTIPPPKAPDPSWLEALGRLLEKLFGPLGRLLGIAWPVLEKIVIGLGVVGLALIAWHLLRRLPSLRRRAPAPMPGWTPDHAEAALLLEDADRLASEGRFDEAAHLLLQRSVRQIAEARPDWLTPSSTAREIAGLPGLAVAAREAVALIADRVERSLFALRPLGAEDWQAAREAYARFALAPLATGSAA